VPAAAAQTPLLLPAIFLFPFAVSFFATPRFHPVCFLASDGIILGYFVRLEFEVANQ
jgi:hypothetical protein